MSNDHREPCPVCGRQPTLPPKLTDVWYCKQHDHLLVGPVHDPDSTKWDAMCRAIRARVVAGVREKVEGLAVGEQDDGCHSGAYLHRDDVLALLDNKEDLT